MIILSKCSRSNRFWYLKMNDVKQTTAVLDNHRRCLSQWQFPSLFTVASFVKRNDFLAIMSRGALKLTRKTPRRKNLMDSINIKYATKSKAMSCFKIPALFQVGDSDYLMGTIGKYSIKSFVLFFNKGKISFAEIKWRF